MRLSEFARSSHAASPTVRSQLYTHTCAPRQPPAFAELRHALLQPSTRLAVQRCTPTRAPRQPPASAELYRTPPQLPTRAPAQLLAPTRAARHARCRPCSLAVVREPVCDPHVSVKVLVVAGIAAPHAARAKYTHHHCCLRRSSPVLPWQSQCNDTYAVLAAVSITSAASTQAGRAGQGRN